MARETKWWEQLAGIEYMGMSGVTAPCKEAVIRLLQCGELIKRARILSYENEHALLLTTDLGDHIAIKSGFASGYGGEGPSGSSYVLALLFAHDVELDERRVSKDLLARLDHSALTTVDIARLERGRTERPSRWGEYVFKDDWHLDNEARLWREFPHVIPFAIVDTRIMDLALKFHERPDECLLTGYRRLEDCVRERTGIEEHGHKLFSQAFVVTPPRLSWKGIDEGERVGRANLFVNVFQAYRNPRAHREPHSGNLGEFLLLNHLFGLENEAVDRRGHRRRRIDTWTRLKKDIAGLGSGWKRPRRPRSRSTGV
jgi:hypothetical protein